MKVRRSVGLFYNYNLFLLQGRLPSITLLIILILIRNEHTMKELEYYRGQHIAAMNQLEATSQETSALRGKYSDLINDKQRLDREVQALQKEVTELRCQNQECLVVDSGNSDAINQHYLSVLRKYEALKDEYDALRKRHDDLLSAHSSLKNKVLVNNIYIFIIIKIYWYDRFNNIIAVFFFLVGGN